MGANTAGIYGAQIFRADDRPLYRRGFSINIAVLAVGLTLATIRFIDDLRRRRRQKKFAVSEASSESGEEGQRTPVSGGDDVQSSAFRGDVKSSQ